MQYNLWHLFSQNNPWLLSFKDTAYTTNGIKQTGFIRGLILQKGKAEVYLLQPSFIFFCFIAVVLFKLCKVEKQYEIQDVQMGYPSSVGLISAEEIARYLQIRGNMLVGFFLFVSKILADVIKLFLLFLLKKKCNSPLLWNQSQSWQQLPDSSAGVSKLPGASGWSFVAGYSRGTCWCRHKFFLSQISASQLTPRKPVLSETTPKEGWFRPTSTHIAKRQ